MPSGRKKSTTKTRKEVARTGDGRWQLLIFSSREDRSDGYGRAKRYLEEASQLNVEAKLINKLTCNIDDLTLVAKHRIVKTPMTILLRGNEERLRVIGFMPISDLEKAMTTTEEA